MMRDRVNPRQRLGDRAYTWLDITTIVTGLLALGIFTYFLFIAITGVN